MTTAFTSFWMTLLAFMAVLFTANGWGDNFKEVTLQYLDANNNIVNTQAAVPTEFVFGKDNEAVQQTSQSATNSIANENIGGRRLLGGWDDWQKFTLQYLDTNNNIVSTQVAVPTQVVIGQDNVADQETSQSASNSIGNANIAGRRLLGGWGDGFKEVTLQYLDADNKIVNTQVAVPTQVVIGQDNLAGQDTTQSADNSIANINEAGRRLLGGWGDGFKEVTLQYLDANNQIVNTQVAIPTQVVIGQDNLAGQDTTQSADNSIANINEAGRRLLGGWGDGFKEVTLQYLDANNQIVNTQVAIPTQVVAGKDNLAVQDTTQSADNSITNINDAGRRLLGHSG